MFEKFTGWIKGVINKMIGKETIKKSLNVEVSISEPMSEAITLWSKVYTNAAPWLTADIKSLKLGAAIASELARMATIEMSVKIQGSQRAEYLQKAIEPLTDNFRKNLEYGLALGGIIIKPYVEGQTMAFDYIKQGSFFPIKFDSNGTMTAAAFISTVTKGEKVFVKVEYRDFDGQKEKITNLAFLKKSNYEPVPISLNSVEEWQNLVEYIEISNVKKPMFAYLKTPNANDIDPESPLGVSVFSRSVDLIKDADEQWYTFKWENDSARRVLHVDSTAFKKDADGNLSIPDRRLYKTLETGEDNFYQEWSPAIRNADITSGLENILRRIEFNSGLAYGTISDPQAVDKTATEVKIAKQRSYSTVADIQKASQKAIDHTIYIMDTMATLYNLAPAGKYETSYDWDDSIVSDRDTQFTEQERAVAAGIISDAEFRAWFKGEDLETAKVNLPKPKSIELPSGI